MPFKSSEKQIFEEGVTIIHKDDDANFAYLINSGQVEVYVNQDERIVSLAKLGPGEIFGESALFGSEKYSASIKAETKTEVSLISKDSLHDALDTIDPTLRSIFFMLLDRLKKTNDSLVKSETREYIDIGFM